MPNGSKSKTQKKALSFFQLGQDELHKTCLCFLFYYNPSSLPLPPPPKKENGLNLHGNMQLKRNCLHPTHASFFRKRWRHCMFLRRTVSRPSSSSSLSLSHRKLLLLCWRKSSVILLLYLLLLLLLSLRLTLVPNQTPRDLRFQTCRCWMVLPRG